MPCMKRVYRDKKASFHWSAARKKGHAKLFLPARIVSLAANLA